MRGYRIVFRRHGDEWSYSASEGGELSLQLRETRDWKTNLLQFSCSHKGAPNIVLTVQYDLSAPGGTEDAGEILKNAKGLVLYWYPAGAKAPPGQIFASYPEIQLAPDEIIWAPSKLADGVIMLAIEFSPRRELSLSRSTDADQIIA